MFAAGREFGSERILHSLLWSKRANTKLYYSLRIEDSLRLAAKSFILIPLNSLFYV
jgi:hypothetical protein